MNILNEQTVLSCYHLISLCYICFINLVRNQRKSHRPIGRRYVGSFVQGFRNPTPPHESDTDHV